MNQPVIWGFGLFAVAFALVVIELFIPSGGIIAITAFIVTVGAIAAFFQESTMWGMTSVLFTLVATPVVLHFAFKIMPHTPVGRRLILGTKTDEEAHQQMVQAQQQSEAEQALVGASGVALTDLRPVGAADIEGQRVEVLAEGGIISAGTPLKVTAVQGNVVKVRAKH